MFETIKTWVESNPELCITAALVLLYAARSAMPRVPNPKWPRWAMVLWELESRALALPWDKWFGRPKIPGALVPPFDVGFDQSEAPTRKEPRT